MRGSWIACFGGGIPRPKKIVDMIFQRLILIFGFLPAVVILFSCILKQNFFVKK